MTTRIHYDLELTLADGTALRLHQEIDAVAVPRKGDLIAFEMVNDAGVQWDFRVSPVTAVMWTPDGSETAIVSRGMQGITGPELQWFIDHGWQIAVGERPWSDPWPQQ